MTSFRLAMNQATTRKAWGSADSIEGCARHGYEAVGLWRDLVSENGFRATRNQLRDLGLAVSGYNRIGPLVGDSITSKRVIIDSGKKVIEEAAYLEAGCVFLFTGGLIPGRSTLQDAQSFTVECLSDLAPFAASAGVPIAIEPLHPMLAGDRGCINTLSHANDICAQFESGVGVVADLYHTWWDPALYAQIRRCGAQYLLGVHVSDWLVPTAHLLTDRGMMGDGVIDFASTMNVLNEVGYDGFIEVEIFSEKWWAVDPDEVLTISKARCEEFVLTDRTPHIFQHS